MKFGGLPIGIALAASLVFGQQTVSISVPGSPKFIEADVYGNGNRGVILAHGGRFDRKSWRKQAQALAGAGFLVLAIGFRGDTVNQDGSPGSTGSDVDNAADVLAAAVYLRRQGVKTLSAVGASFGGNAVGNAEAQQAGTFDRTVFFGSSGGDTPAKLSGRKLFIVARDDSSPSGPRLPEISDHYAKAPQPKKLVIVEGSAHAQFLFRTEQGPAVMKEILDFLSRP